MQASPGYYSETLSKKGKEEWEEEGRKGGQHREREGMEKETVHSCWRGENSAKTAAEQT